LAEKTKNKKQKKQKTKNKKQKTLEKSWEVLLLGQDLGYLGYWKRISIFLKFYSQLPTTSNKFNTIILHGTTS